MEPVLGLAGLGAPVNGRGDVRFSWGVGGLSQITWVHTSLINVITACHHAVAILAQAASKASSVSLPALVVIFTRPPARLTREPLGGPLRGGECPAHSLMEGPGFFTTPCKGGSARHFQTNSWVSLAPAEPQAHPPTPTGGVYN